MSVDVRLKHSKISSRVPTSGDLTDGELGLNLADEKIYMKNADGDVVQVAGKGGGDGEYVKVAGDNMTGDLTLGTDKITLDASGGSIVASGVVGTEVPPGDYGVFVNNADLNETCFVVEGSGTTKIGPVFSNSAFGITLNPRAGSDEAYILLNDTGSANLAVSASGVAGYYDGTEYKWKLETNGSASFAGTVLSGDSTFAGPYTYMSTTSIGVMLNLNTPMVTLENDGSAEFQGEVKTLGGTVSPVITLMLEPDDDANYTITTEEYEETIRVPVVGGGVATADLVNGAPEQQFTEQTVTRTREIKTYTGPTLDVKEQLLAYEERFKQQDAVIAQMTEALKKLGADIDPRAASKKSTKKK